MNTINLTTNYYESLAKSIAILTDRQIVKCLKKEIKDYDSIVKQYDSFKDFVKENISIIRCSSNSNCYIYYKDKFVCCVEQKLNLQSNKFSIKTSKREIHLKYGLS